MKTLKKMLKKIVKLEYTQFFIFSISFPISFSKDHWTSRELGSKRIWSSDHSLHMRGIGKSKANQIL